MRSNLPSLNLLRGFEAAARHLSFTKAADELNVTQGAISRQIRELEFFFDKPLFVRMTRKIALTSDGEAFFEQVSSALKQIDEAVQVMLHQSNYRHIKLSIPPTLSTHWLMPRLSEFTKNHPDVKVTLLSSVGPTSLADHDADIAIRVEPLPGHGQEPFRSRFPLDAAARWSRMTAEELFPNILVPVCTRQLLGERPYVSPIELSKMPLIQTTARPYSWSTWLNFHNIPMKGITFAMEFGHYFMALDAARQGIGVAIVPSVIYANYVHGGDLTIPISPEDVRNTPKAGTYYMYTAADETQRPEIHDFRMWIRSQAALLTSNVNAMFA